MELSPPAPRRRTSTAQTSFECPTIGPQACRELVPDQLVATLAAAKAADVVVLVLGLNSKITNMEGQDR